MGVKLLVPEHSRLNSVLGVVIPAGVSPDLVRSHMSRVHRVEVSGAFGQNMVRIGQMGEQSRAHNLFKTLHALGASLQHGGAKIDLPSGIAELEKGLSRELANTSA